MSKTRRISASSFTGSVKSESCHAMTWRVGASRLPSWEAMGYPVIPGRAARNLARREGKGTQVSAQVVMAKPGSPSLAAWRLAGDDIALERDVTFLKCREPSGSGRHGSFPLSQG